MALQNAGDFSASGLIVSVPGGTVGFPGRATLVAKTLAAGAAALLTKWSAKVVDIGNSDQIYFHICRNGQPIQSGLERIPGLQFDFQSQIDLNLAVGGGEISIVALNISGMSNTIEPSAIAGSVTIQCQAWWAANLLSEKGGVS